MIMCALVELIQHTRAPPWKGRREGGKEGGREGRGGREGGEGTMKEERKEKEDCGETTGRLPRTKGTEEVLNVVCRHLLWKCHQEHMLPRYWSYEGVRGRGEGV